MKFFCFYALYALFTHALLADTDMDTPPRRPAPIAPGAGARRFPVPPGQRGARALPPTPHPHPVVPQRSDLITGNGCKLPIRSGASIEKFRPVARQLGASGGEKKGESEAEKTERVRAAKVKITGGIGEFSKAIETEFGAGGNDGFLDPRFVRELDGFVSTIQKASGLLANNLNVSKETMDAILQNYNKTLGELRSVLQDIFLAYIVDSKRPGITEEQKLDLIFKTFGPSNPGFNNYVQLLKSYHSYQELVVKAIHGLDDTLQKKYKVSGETMAMIKQRMGKPGVSLSKLALPLAELKKGFDRMGDKVGLEKIEHFSQMIANQQNDILDARTSMQAPYWAEKFFRDNREDLRRSRRTFTRFIFSNTTLKEREIMLSDSTILESVADAYNKAIDSDGKGKVAGRKFQKRYIPEMQSILTDLNKKTAQTPSEGKEAFSINDEKRFFSAYEKKRKEYKKNRKVTEKENRVKAVKFIDKHFSKEDAKEIKKAISRGKTRNQTVEAVLEVRRKSKEKSSLAQDKKARKKLFDDLIKGNEIEDSDDEDSEFGDDDDE